VRVAALLILTLCACHSTPQQPARPKQGATGNVQTGYASFYNEAQMTASGERFDKNAFTAAHRSLPFGTIVRVTNQHNGLSVEVRINDRGPYGGHGRIIDLSEAAARVLRMIDAGVVPVRLEVLGKR
jgi:rare lipoprotein A